MKPFLKHFIFVVILSISMAGVVLAEEDFKYISPTGLKGMIESGSRVTILDIQVADEYNAHHIKGAISTYAYPVKSDEDRGKLDRVFTDISSGSESVVIVCPRGAGGAKRTYTYLRSTGIPEKRLLILRGGQSSWPFPALLEK